MRPLARTLATLLAAALATSAPASAQTSLPRGSTPAPDPETSIHDGREYLVPELAQGRFHVTDGERPYEQRLSFYPAFGSFGSDRLYALRLAYNPHSWLGYEAGLGHTPGESVHAVVHTVSAQLRHPFPGRFQPYVTGGYGMILVFPGESLNADPATENVLTYGAGLEAYLRDDLAIRVEARGITIIGDDPITEESVAYQYGEATIGLVFYRSLVR